MVEGETLVVDAEKMQHGGVVVVPVDGIFDRFPADVVGAAVGDAALEAGARHPD